MATVLVNHVLCQNDSNLNCFKFGEKISTKMEVCEVLSTNLNNTPINAYA